MSRDVSHTPGPQCGEHGEWMRMEAYNASVHFNKEINVACMKDTRIIYALRTIVLSRDEERAKSYASLDASSQNASVPQSRT